ncbi:MAG: prepilin-type N-terminal cleavage/methylation domain-containing protein, partial [Candidatus Omnitrophota bacterium]
MGRNNKRSNSGFSLVELMIAAGILVFAIVGLMSTFISGSILGISSHSLIVAATDAQHVMEKIKDLPYESLATDMET